MRAEWLDRFTSSDPGLTRLISSLHAVVAVGIAMLVEWLFVRATHAMQIDVHGAQLPSAQAALIAAQHHGVTVIAIMVGAVMAIVLSTSAPMFPTLRGLLTAYVLTPPLMVGGFALGLALGSHRVWALTSLAVVLAAGTYTRRFGPVGFVGGVMAFLGTFFGFFLSGEIHFRNLGWLTAEVTLGVLVAVIAQFTLFYPGKRAAVRRMIRSYSARCRRVAGLAMSILDASPAERARLGRRMHRLLVRLNESALMIDAQIGDQRALPRGMTASELHQMVFDGELAVTNLARFTLSLLEADVPQDLHSHLRSTLQAVERADPQGIESNVQELLRGVRELDIAADDSRSILLHRFTGSARSYAALVNRWRAVVAAHRDADSPTAEGTEPFVPATVLLSGWLPGSALASARASLETSPTFWGRFRMPPYARTALQLGVAVTAAIIFGDMLSGRRFYWAVISAFVTFMGASNAGEQLRKGVNRLLGTLVGVFLGAFLAHAIGHRTGYAVAVILVALFVGLYLMRVSYAFFVIAITVTVSQLYEQLDEFSDALLRLRVEETALGAAIAILTVLCVFPLHVRRVANVAVRDYLAAMKRIVQTAVARMRLQATPEALRLAERELDAAYQTMVAVTASLRMPLTGATDAATRQLLHTVDAARHYARNLVLDTDKSQPLGSEDEAHLAAAGDQLVSSIDELLAAADDHAPRNHTYVRSAALFEQVDASDDTPGRLSSRLAIRDLQLIDGALANIAAASEMAVLALDAPATQNGRASVFDRRIRPPA